MHRIGGEIEPKLPEAAEGDHGPHCRDERRGPRRLVPQQPGAVLSAKWHKVVRIVSRLNVNQPVDGLDHLRIKAAHSRHTEGIGRLSRRERAGPREVGILPPASVRKL